MSSLFTLPCQIPLNGGAIMAGAKLHFFQTLTTTPQNTYQDNARTTPHANPVVADSNGVFAPIYLDPTLPDYRVRLTTAADVQLYQKDGIPSNQNTQQSVRLESANPFLFLHDTDGTAGFNKYRIRANGNAFAIESSNAAETVFDSVISVTAGVVGLPNGALVGTDLIAHFSTGSFSGTYTGLTTSPTEAMFYSLTGNVVVVQIAGTTATSNATTLTVTGMSAAIRPAFDLHGVLCRVVDNGTTSLGVVSIGSNGTLTFGLGAANGAFTSSGTKGLASTVLVYKRT